MRTSACIAIVALLALPLAARAQAPRPAADSAWERGDRAAAHTLYLECVDSDTTDATALFRLGLLAGWDGRHRESIAWFDRLLAMHPEDRDARVARARAVAATGGLSTAIAAVDSILSTHPDETSALTARARFAEWERDIHLAERLWRRALEIDPEHAGARAGLAGTLRRHGRTVEARREAALALAATPDDADVVAASDRIERLFRPRVRTGVTVEDDSDGNTITSFFAGAGYRPADRIDVNADAWTRSAGLAAAAADVTANGARIGVAYDSPSGWVFGGAIGASSSQDAGSPTSAALSAFTTTPADRAAIFAVEAARTPLDYTLPLVRNRVVLTEGSISVRASRGRNWDFDASAGLATFDVRATGQDSRRTALSTSARRRLDDSFAVTFGARLFGFDRDVDGGFFDPDAYGLLDAALAWHREPAGWILDAEVAPGLQRIGSGGAATAAVRTSAAATRQFRPGRQITIRGAFANTGLQQLSDVDGASYRYASIAFSFAWWF